MKMKMTKPLRALFAVGLLALLLLAPVAQASGSSGGPGLFGGPQALLQLWLSWWNGRAVSMSEEGRPGLDPNGSSSPAPYVEAGRPGLDINGVAATDENESEDDRNASIDPTG
jgi:hypothetical protein